MRRQWASFQYGSVGSSDHDDVIMKLGNKVRQTYSVRIVIALFANLCFYSCMHVDWKAKGY